MAHGDLLPFARELLTGAARLRDDNLAVERAELIDGWPWLVLVLELRVHVVPEWTFLYAEAVWDGRWRTAQEARAVIADLHIGLMEEVGKHRYDLRDEVRALGLDPETTQPWLTHQPDELLRHLDGPGMWDRT